MDIYHLPYTRRFNPELKRIRGKTNKGQPWTKLTHIRRMCSISVEIPTMNSTCSTKPTRPKIISENDRKHAVNDNNALFRVTYCKKVDTIIALPHYKIDKIF